MSLSCPYCHALLSPEVDETAAQIIPPTIQVTGLRLVAPPPPPPAPPPVPAPAVIAGVPFGPTQLPIGELGKRYTGTVLNANAPSLLKDLALVRSLKGRVILGMRRSTLQDATGLNPARASTEISTWGDIQPFLTDGTVIALYAADDISKDEWGIQYSMTQRLVMWDQIYGFLKARWPKAPTIARAKAAELSGHVWKNLDLCWAAYRGPYRDGTPEQFRDTQVANTKTAGFKGVVIWPNALDGGCGPGASCLTGIPGSSVLGTYKDAAALHRWQTSGAEMRAYGKVFLPETFAAFHWRWSPNYSSSSLPATQLQGIRDFETRPDVVQAMDDLAKLAAATPFRAVAL